MIIAVDYDGTLQFDNGDINHNLIRRLVASQKRGDIVILWTCREGQRLAEAVSILNANGFQPNVVNDNHPSVIARLKRNPRKVLADIYIDDKGAN